MKTLINWRSELQNLIAEMSSRGKCWMPVAEVPVKALTFHPEWIAKNAQNWWISCIEKLSIPADVAAYHKAIIMGEVAYASCNAAFPRVNCCFRRCLFPFWASARRSSTSVSASCCASRQRCQSIDVTGLVSKRWRTNWPSGWEYIRITVILTTNSKSNVNAIPTEIC